MRLPICCALALPRRGQSICSQPCRLREPCCPGVIPGPCDLVLAVAGGCHPGRDVGGALEEEAEKKVDGAHGSSSDPAAVLLNHHRRQDASQSTYSRPMSRTLDQGAVLGPRALAIQMRFEVPVLVAALLVVPVIVIEEQGSSGGLQLAAHMLNWLIWVVFVAELVALLATVNQRGSFLRLAWLDLVIVVVSFPLLPAIFAGSRILRLFRLARIGTVLGRGSSAIRSVFGSHGVAYAATLTLLVALGAGGLFLVTEPDKAGSFGNALWWAITTITTVGYGDVVPQSTAGRAAAVVVMLVGIGFVAILTAAIAARFVESQEADLTSEIQRLHDRLERIEQAIQDDKRQG